MSRVWTITKVMDCAAACRTYRDFRERFPNAYDAAFRENWLDAVIIHCGWIRLSSGGTVVLPPRPPTLSEILGDGESMLDDAMGSDLWPTDGLEGDLFALPERIYNNAGQYKLPVKEYVEGK